MRKWMIILALLMSQTVQAGEWVKLKPIRENTIGKWLGDIDCHMPAGHIYADSDKVTWGHETTHGINSRLRNEFHSKNGFYLINNDGFIIGSPKLTLKQVADNIPQNIRGRSYQLYMVDQQSGWNDTPFYMMDECSAYVNGTLVGIQYNLKDRSVYSFDNALELWSYMKIAQEMSRQTNFSEQKELDKFMDKFYNNRILFIKQQFKLKGW